jgi:hypothetical protein
MFLFESKLDKSFLNTQIFHQQELTAELMATLVAVSTDLEMMVSTVDINKGAINSSNSSQVAIKGAINKAGTNKAVISKTETKL